MQIKMDTDAVRSMSSKFRQTADSMDASLASIKATVESAGWQSQAREEFILRLEMLRRTSTQSATVLRMMAQAADRKAEQWEAIANFFNGPFHYLGNIWSSVVAFFSGIGSSIWNAITNIHLPSLPTIVLPSISGAAIVGGITSIIPKWEWNPPDWWPFNKNTESASGSGGGSWGGEEGTDPGNSNDSNSNTENNSGGQASQNYLENLAPGDYFTADIDTNPPLPNDLPQWKGYCGRYVQNVVPNIKDNIGSAKNYIGEYSLSPFTAEADLRTQLQPGDVVVWDAGQQGANSTHGHAAVIIEVHEDYVVFAESSWDGIGNPRVGRTETADYLNDLYIWSNPDIEGNQINIGHY
ncbi:MAG: WXG100 family type VII secretion target [Anaerolineaceae bacterium]|nr:WXG100 family type VII secretion target [Anaerolineaceae bacterium]